MKKILIIGIGAGDPDYVTMQAVKALNQVDVFFILDKGEEKSGLTALRREICARYIAGDAYRFVDADSPAWPRDSADYRATIDGLNRDKRALFERLIADAMGDDECGAFLVWGDPALYDSTVRIVDAIARESKTRESGLAFEYDVIPGISAAQALVAKHRTTLNTIGRPVAITTGRRLAEGFPDGSDSVVVMLDAGDTYKRFADQDMEIFWGAYVGTPDEILIAGKLRDVADEIARVRAEARQTHGWIMDTYLLRKSGGGA
jgi:precorrin-6A synthase